MRKLSSEFKEPPRVPKDTNARSPLEDYLKIAEELGFKQVGHFADVAHIKTSRQKRAAAPPEKKDAPKLLVLASRDGMFLTLTTAKDGLEEAALHMDFHTSEKEYEQWLKSKNLVRFMSGSCHDKIDRSIHYLILNARAQNTVGLREAVHFARKTGQLVSYWEDTKTLKSFKANSRPNVTLETNAEFFEGNLSRQKSDKIGADRRIVVCENIGKMMGFEIMQASTPESPEI